MPRQLVACLLICAVIAIVAILVAGCAGQPTQVPIPKPVPVPGPTQYIPVPAELLKCQGDADAPATNGELLESWRSRGDRLAECLRSIQAVRGLRAPGAQPRM